MTSVYCGCFTGDYGDLANADIYDAAPYQATGKGKAMLANRISWFFDLRGSSFTVDTACSSSLYALHLACQSLRLKESKMVRSRGLNNFPNSVKIAFDWMRLRLTLPACNNRLLLEAPTCS